MLSRRLTSHHLRPRASQLAQLISNACSSSISGVRARAKVLEYVRERGGNTTYEAAMALIECVASGGDVAVQAVELLRYCSYSDVPFLATLSQPPLLQPLLILLEERALHACLVELFATLEAAGIGLPYLSTVRKVCNNLRAKGYELSGVLYMKMYSKSELRRRQELAYSARLQACLRRGSKEDLREANGLVKILAGDPEVGGLQQEGEEMLVWKEMIAGVREQVSTLGGALEGKVKREVRYDGFVNKLAHLLQAERRKIDEIEADGNLTESLRAVRREIEEVLQKHRDLVVGGERRVVEGVLVAV
ncbi:unnamed protein product [Tuber melanosporum]|uniref:(Perigord truffle) hypothetical protein n=1 Tax=Tuber melanosporum (strain Mel28) TaxID=656061 RepID=D5GCB9_TUBMM|nr:uncharacterized protein GSTUM_00005809001 [Tuber melanosporum]CAZ82162.1 unnamed protein product [Tuber melanosporum]